MKVSYPTVSTMRQLDNERTAYFDMACTALPIEYDMADGGTFSLESLDPGLLVQIVLQEAPNLASLYLDTHARKPCTRQAPWHAIIGFDEFNPGNPTAGTHSKKSMCVYFSFTELGALLAVDVAWFCPLILACNVEAEIEGRWSRVLADFLERFLYGPFGFSTVGVLVAEGGRRMHLFATIGVIISDGDGLRKGFNWKGASSMRPCFIHDNCLKKGSCLNMPGWYEITHACARDFTVRSSNDLYDSCDKIEAAHRRWRHGGITKSLFENICKSEALNFHPQALLWRMSLRSPDFLDKFRYDWCHTLLQDGPMQKDLDLYLAACSDVVGLDDVKDWMQLDWLFPRATGSKSRQLWRIFTESRVNDEGKLKCSMSEILGVYSLVRLLLEHSVPDVPERRLAKESFSLCCRLVDILQAAKQLLISMEDASQLLLQTHEAYLRKHIEAYGTEHITPKFHWIFDIVMQLAVDPQLYDQFIIERLHLGVKDEGVRVDNLRRWERSILSMHLYTHIHAAKEMQGVYRLLSDRRPPKTPTCLSATLANAVLAGGMQVMGMKIYLDDLVSWRNDIGKVIACGRDYGPARHGKFFLVIQVWEHVGFKL